MATNKALHCKSISEHGTLLVCILGQVRVYCTPYSSLLCTSHVCHDMVLFSCVYLVLHWLVKMAEQYEKALRKVEEKVDCSICLEMP